MKKLCFVLRAVPVFMALSLILSGCGSEAEDNDNNTWSTADSTSSAEEPEDLSASEIILTSPDESLSITLTDGFLPIGLVGSSERVILPEGFILGAYNQDHQAYLLFTKETKAADNLASYIDFREALVSAVAENEILNDARKKRTVPFVLEGSGLPGDVTEIYANYIPEDALSGAGSISSPEDVLSAMSSMPEMAESIAESVHRDDNDAVLVRLYTIEGPRDYMQFMCWCDEGEMKHLESDFDAMVSSLYFAGNGLRIGD